MKHWLIILSMTAATFPIRASFMVFGNKLNFPPIIRRALQYVPAAVLSALIAPMALMPKGSMELGLSNPYLIGTLVAGSIAFATRKTLLAIVASFAIYGAMRFS